MIPVLLIVIPLVTGLLGFLLRSEKSARGWALLSSLITLVIALWGVGIDSNIVTASLKAIVSAANRAQRGKQE